MQWTYIFPKRGQFFGRNKPSSFTTTYRKDTFELLLTHREPKHVLNRTLSYGRNDLDLLEVCLFV